MPRQASKVGMHLHHACAQPACKHACEWAHLEASDGRQVVQPALREAQWLGSQVGWIKPQVPRPDRTAPPTHPLPACPATHLAAQLTAHQPLPAKPPAPAHREAGALVGGLHVDVRVLQQALAKQRGAAHCRHEGGSGDCGEGTNPCFQCPL